jgi:hypothetical protein
MKDVSYWKNEINIRDFLTEEPELPAEKIKEIGKKLADYLQSQPCINGFKLDDLRKAECEGELNDALDNLYDFCDKEKVWVKI